MRPQSTIGIGRCSSSHRVDSATKFEMMRAIGFDHLIDCRTEDFTRNGRYLNERFEAGQLSPVIDGPYKLSDAREAFRHFGEGAHNGKVVITME